MGGEHSIEEWYPFLRHGSSPRGRGTRLKRSKAALCPRFIPAWAGNTPPRAWPPPRWAVHPRVGGEHDGSQSQPEKQAGSSPRGRGTRSKRKMRTGCTRFIPAWAGNTLGRTPTRRRRTVHPRVGGEHLTCRRHKAMSPVHPRVGGEHIHPRTIPGCAPGSSPRGRGTPKPCRARQLTDRFIPAWAGNTTVQVGTAPVAAVHPRVGGEHCTGFCRTQGRLGSSPRGRGTQSRSYSDRQRLRFIPAWAGNTVACAVAHRIAAVHPRVGGEHR